MLDAYEKLPLAIRQRFPLIIAGYKGWKNEEIHARINKAKQKGWVSYLGFVPTKHLPVLFAGARLFTFPSLYEGFGLPILEAMSSGVPVICSNGDTLQEVAKDAALMASPNDIDAWSELINQGLLDERWRKKAIKLGQFRSSQFSWKRCANETMNIYKAYF